MARDGAFTRRRFLAAAALVPAALAAASQPEKPGVVPTEWDGGRFFAVPRVARDNAVMRLWLDTDGDGFVFSEAVARWNLPVIADPHGGRTRWTRLPRFAPSASIPELHARGGLLPIFTRDASARADPILRGFDGQLGAGWFQNRVWTFDYRFRLVVLRDASRADDGDAGLVSFPLDAHGRRMDGQQFPRVRVRVGEDAAQTMTFDTAASVALTPGARTKFGDGLPALRATSFVRSSVLKAWRAAHRDWPMLQEVGVQRGIDAIRVPSVRVGAIALGPQWFTTRPGDDVFQGEDAHVDGKLGGSAFIGRLVTLDYPEAILAIR